MFVDDFGIFVFMFCLEIVLFYLRKQVKYIFQIYFLELIIIVGISVFLELIIFGYFNFYQSKIKNKFFYS